METMPRYQAIQHLEAALASGVRGQLREAIQASLDLATAPRQRELTDIHYDTLKPGQRLIDQKRPGFLMRANKSSKVWIYRYTHPVTGKQIEHRIGCYPEISLQTARQVWKVLRLQRLSGQIPQSPETISRKYHGILPESLPVPVPIEANVGFIYFLFDGKQCVYVGMTGYSVHNRIEKHKKDKTFDGFSFISVNSARMEEFESRLILALRPKYNRSVRFAKPGHAHQKAEQREAA